MINDIQKILISEDEIKQKVKIIGQKIAQDYQGKNLMLVSVLKGSVTFMADLMRAIDTDLAIDFMSVSSYGNNVRTAGVVKIIKDIDMPLNDYDILIVEDILDSGLTLSYLLKHIERKNPRSIKIATLLDKPERRKVDVFPEYKCFSVPDEFVVGYGLDFAEKYRNLPFIGILKPEVYEK